MQKSKKPGEGLRQHELDDTLVASIANNAQVANILLLHGYRRQFDRFCIAATEAGGGPRIVSLETMAHDALQALASWLFDPVSSQVSLLRIATGQAAPSGGLPSQPGQPVAMDLPELLTAFLKQTAPTGNQRLMLLIDTCLPFEDPAAPHDDDFQILRALERFSRNAPRSHILVLRVPQSTAVPGALIGNPKVRSVYLPATSRDVRKAYTQLRAKTLVNQCQSTAETVSSVVAACTEDWDLDSVDALIQSAQRNGITNLVEVEELARAIRIGVSKSPWVGPEIRDAVRHAQSTLEKRVKGQPAAISAVVKSLIKAVVGLVGGHEGRNTNMPRGAWLLAGPTGTGKTELAKAVATMIYGDEIIIRFDCSELSSEHAVARLIGAPPGYVGFERGGELTEAVRARPNAIVLFDEIEKANPKIWDFFLQILGDGRLTDGSGETADFSQTLIIFTSNLGMYEERPNGLGGVERIPRFGLETPFETIEKEVREAVRHYFVTRLGRPELLGRLGGHENVVVFGFLAEPGPVIDKFVANLVSRCHRLYATELDVTPAVRQALLELVQKKPDALILGGRGIATEMDRMLVDPLASYLFDTSPSPARLRAEWAKDHVQFVPG